MIEKIPKSAAGWKTGTIFVCLLCRLCRSGATDASDAVSTLLADAIGLSLRAEAERRAESASNVSADEVETTASSDIEIIASPQAGILQTYLLFAKPVLDV